MRITLTNTDQVIELVLPGGAVVPARVWTGETANGVPVLCWITRVLVPHGQPAEAYAQFERQLLECEPARPGLPPIGPRQIL